MRPAQRTALALVFVAAAVPLAAQQRASTREELWAGKIRTERSIEVRTVVDAEPRDAYELWLSPAGLRTFFAPGARIDPVVGGRYEVLFDPQGDPEGELEGTKGARILALDPGAFLAFEWRGRASMKEMNVTPLPTWVEVTLTPVAGQKGKTRVELVHHGFGTGGTWEIAHVFFKGAWRAVLDSLQVYCARLNPPAPPSRDEEARLSEELYRAAR